ncbi:outer membrane protein assembly factor BamB family protein [Halospeciosus flavus]|nr:PQQ-binding-like beta-propeller repeat protein [Halospeciosus flavus]
MPSITRRRLLGGAAAIAAGAYGTYRLDQGATDATFTSWSPKAGTWPLRRYDPANTAYNPNAGPPREPPNASVVATAPTTAKQPYFYPIVSSDYLAMHGSGITVLSRDAGEPVHTSDTATLLAGFGPDGTLHTARRVAENSSDPPTAIVGYRAGELRETYRVPLGTNRPQGMSISEREVYVGTSDGTLQAIDPTTGRGWQADGALPALLDGQLYAADAPLDGAVAYTQRTGLDRRLAVGPKQVWTTGTDHMQGFAHRPTIANGRFVQGSYATEGGAVVAFDADSGEHLWGPRSLGMDVATPAVVGDRGYTAVGTDDLQAGLVVALDLETGETIWRDSVDWYAFAPVVSEDTLVVAGEVRRDGEQPTGKVRAYDRATGEILWTHSLANDPDGLALVEDRVLVTAGPELYELA